MWSSILLFHVVVLLYGSVGYALIGRSVSPGFRILLSAGMAPLLLSLLLFYLWWLVPGLSDGAVAAVVGSVPLILLGVARFLGFSVFPSVELLVGTPTKKMVVLGYLLVVAGSCFYLTQKDLSEHDALEYAYQGKVFYQDKNIDFVPHRYDEASGYYYIGLHGFGYPLLASFDYLVQNLALGTDLFAFRFSSFYFGFLALLLVFYWLSRIRLDLGLAGVVFTAFTYGFLFNLLRYQLDTIRTFYLLATLALGFEILKNPTQRHVVLLGVLLGLQGMVHSIGIIFSGVWLGVLFLFLEAGFTDRVKWALGVGATTLLAGGIHYVMDVAIGTGWVFRDIQFF